MKALKEIPKLGFTVLLGLLALAALFPVLLTAASSLMQEQEISANYELIGTITDAAHGQKDAFANLKLIPDWVTFEQYKEVLVQNPKFLKMFWNSAAMVAPIIIGQIAVASMAAYAFAKLRFRGRDRLFMVYLLTMLMPFQVTLVPNYMIIDRLGLMNTEAAVILPGIFSAFGVFMLRQFMLHIPDSLLEAAKMDGAGHPLLFARMVLPLVKPGLAALCVLLFVDYWNMVEQPLIFLQDAAKQPLSLYLAYISKEARGIGFAAAVVYMAPMVLLFLYAESYFVEGVQLSGMKG